MKLVSAFALILAFSGIAYAAPMSTDSAGDVSVETAAAGNRGGVTTLHECGPMHNPNTDPVPEPASLALLGIGLGAAALRRKK